MNKHGILMCARYAASPNFFGYCGPDKNSSLVDHIKDDIADREVTHILSEFETLYPYLRLIAEENKIEDFYDLRVVEAYWIGNSLLCSVKNIYYISFLKELLQIEKRMSKQTLSVVKSKLNKGKILPHHAFHVFNIFKKTAKDISFEAINTMDECRIGWGRVMRISKSDLTLYVETKPLELINNKLRFGKIILKKIQQDFNNIKLFNNLKKGDLTSFHWSNICDKVTNLQVKNLEYYTQKAIDFYNE